MKLQHRKVMSWCSKLEPVIAWLNSFCSTGVSSCLNYMLLQYLFTRFCQVVRTASTEFCNSISSWISWQMLQLQWSWSLHARSVVGWMLAYHCKNTGDYRIYMSAKLCFAVRVCAHACVDHWACCKRKLFIKKLRCQTKWLFNVTLN